MFHDFIDDDDTQETARLTARARIAHVRDLMAGRGRQLALVMVFMVVSVCAEIAGPLVLRHLIDVRVPQGRIGGMAQDALLYMGLAVVLSVAFFLQVSVASKMGLAVVTELKRRLFRKVLRKGLLYFDATTPGALLARVESDGDRVQTLCSQAAGELARNILLLLGTFAVMMRTNWRLTALVMVFLAPPLVVMPLFFRIAYRLYRKARCAYTDLSSVLGEFIAAVPILQVFGATRWASSRLSRAGVELFHRERNAALLDYSFWSVLHSTEVVLVGAVVWLASGNRMQSLMSLGTLVLFLEYARQIYFPLLMFGEQLGFINRAFASADRVFGLLEGTECDEGVNGSVISVPRQWNRLRFEDVSFSYDGSAPALRSVSFDLARGEKVALVGLSGGGKTTITNLLLRFYEPQDGAITVDGQDIRRFPLREWRRRVGLVLQEITLFPGTIEENVRAFATDISRLQVDHALRVVGADRFVCRLPKGPVAAIAEGGMNLSLGERQLLSIARAVVRDPDILILDEATSSVDAATETRLQESMARAFEGRTVIIVAHRLSTLRSVDRILVIHEGRVAQEGGHHELYTQRGMYRQLYDLQSAQRGRTWAVNA
ncbi:ABC transporter ATP-binding protein [Candidatus Fermentibacteria bacterium]|nr:ABC transporter ATP-binding protein [Candidatus Fermentibacteria bacterium]